MYRCYFSVCIFLLNFCKYLVCTNVLEIAENIYCDIQSKMDIRLHIVQPHLIHPLSKMLYNITLNCKTV